MCYNTSKLRCIQTSDINQFQAISNQFVFKWRIDHEESGTAEAAACDLCLLFNLFITPKIFSQAIKDVDYSSFLSMVKEGEVDKAQIESNYIYFQDKAEEPTFYRTATFNDPDLVNRLDEAGVSFGRIVETKNSGLVYLLTLFAPLILFSLLGNVMSRRIMKSSGGIGAGNPFLSFGKSNAKMYVPSTTSISFADVAGEEEAKSLLQELVSYLHDPQKYAEIGAQCPKGALLVGPPGTGKTLLAKAVAGEAHVPFFSIAGSEFVEMFVGMGASKVRDLFDQAEKNAPCIVFIDEIDTIGKKRDGQGFSSNDERASLSWPPPTAPIPSTRPCCAPAVSTAASPSSFPTCRAESIFSRSMRRK